MSNNQSNRYKLRSKDTYNHFESPYIKTLDINESNHDQIIQKIKTQLIKYKSTIASELNYDINKSNCTLNINSSNYIVDIADYNDYHIFQTTSSSEHYINKLIENLIDTPIKKLIIVWFLKYDTDYYPILISEYNVVNLDDLQCIETHIYENKYIIDDKWISASKTRNFLLDDPLIDYLEYNKIFEPEDLNTDSISRKRKYSEMSVNQNKDPDTFLSKILSNGIRFEDIIFKELLKNYKKDIVTIIDINTYDKYTQKKIRDPVYFNMTIEMIKKGVPIIYQGVLHNNIDLTFGLPDLLIRADYINKIFNAEIDIYTEKINSINQYPYYVVDIKNSVMHLSARSDNVLNFLGSKPYKGQIAIYHKIISQIQKFDTGRGFILSSKWTRKCKDINYQCTNPFDRLGIIDFNNTDITYVDLSEKAVKWLQLIKDSNNNLNCKKPNNINLYPNMCNNLDGKYRKVKKYLAEKNHEISNLWMCGPKQRLTAINNGIDNWLNPKLNSKILGVNGKNANTIDLILKINRLKSKKISDLIHPKKIKSELNGWRDRDKLAFYVDFETLNSTAFEQRNWADIDINNPNANDIIFMIGIGYSINNKWNYECFTIDDLKEESQIKVIQQMITFVKETSSKYGYVNDKYQDVSMYHWSNFEPLVLSKVCTKFHMIMPVFKWTDILKMFHEEPIIIKGAYNFSLKTIGKALYDLKLITTIWDDNIDVKNGLDAMFQAYQIYLTGENIRTNKQMLNIIEYNIIDCKIMWDILNTLAKII